MIPFDVYSPSVQIFYCFEPVPEKQTLLVRAEAIQLLKCGDSRAVEALTEPSGFINRHRAECSGAKSSCLKNVTRKMSRAAAGIRGFVQLQK